MKRLAVLLLLVGCLSLAAGCTTLAKAGLGEVLQFKTRFLELEGGSAAWTTYEAIELGRISDEPVRGLAPADLKAELVPLAAQQLEKGRFFKRVGGSGPEKTLLVTGQIIDFCVGSSAGARVVGFGDKPFIIVRTTLVDKHSGKALATVNLQSTADSLRDWTQVVSRGYGKSIEKYLESKGLKRLPEEKPPAAN